MDKPKNIISYKIRNTLFNYLRNKGYFVHESTGRTLLIEFFKRLKPISTKEDLIRIGGKGDGGYLIPNCLDDIEACFSPGVAETANFENDLLNKYKIKSHLADFSVDREPLVSKNFSFTKKYIDIYESDENIRLIDWIKNYEEDYEHNDYILQMDIENAEWRVLHDVQIEDIKRFRIMVIEFHGFATRLLEPVSFGLVDSLFRKILDHFSVVHIHPNNCCPISIKEDIVIPDTVEITFLRKDFINESDKETIFPHPLDEKNVPEKDDVIMQEIWNLKL